MPRSWRSSLRWGSAGLLRQLRAEAGLTQEELAEAAGLSPRSVSDLERGINRTARKDTAVLLAGALGLAEPARSLFVAAARGRVPAARGAGGPARAGAGWVARVSRGHARLPGRADQFRGPGRAGARGRGAAGPSTGW